MTKPKIAPGKIGFTVGRTYRAPLKTVWEAATQAKHLNKYFCDGAKGNIAADMKPVRWAWKGYGGTDLHLVKVVPQKLVEFHWDAGEGYDILVSFEFSKKNGRSVLHISERGWKTEHLPMAFSYCQGWTEFVTYLKAYLLYGVDFRKWPTKVKR
jgi:uncharacterized protein YndB with AHSA1/START domain